ncbi:MAG TPA: M48 family metallopeptidase, partial [Candidatus Baltobacteraceae bacterium]|nr:M48 family metallopeptidase [Candidatus Baltobacteraceae bacterium]
ISTVPNAFYVYGPRIYVNRGLIRLADSREELAAVLCHEMSHALHRDGSNDDQGAQAYDARTKRLIAQSEAMTHGHLGQPISGLAQYGENFVWLHHSRKQEERADLAGADLCAAAKFNPWGMVWMFQKLERVAGSGGFAWFSDHPDTKTRIAALKHHFRQYPAVFVSFNSDEITATPLWMGVVQAPAPQQDSWGFLSLERRMKQARRAVVGLGQIPLLRLQLHSISGEGSS